MKRQTKKELRLELKRLYRSFSKQRLAADEILHNQYRDLWGVHQGRYGRLLMVTRTLAADCWGDEAAKRLSFALHGSTKVLPIL